MYRSLSSSSVEASDSIWSLLSGISITTPNEQLSSRYKDKRSLPALQNDSMLKRKTCNTSPTDGHYMFSFKHHLSFNSPGKGRDENKACWSLRHFPNRTRSTPILVRKTSSNVVSPNQESLLSDSISVSNCCKYTGLQKNQYSPWEQWMAKKRADREKRAQERKKLSVRSDNGRQQEQEKDLERKRIAKAKMRAWVENKNLEARKQKELAGLAHMQQEMNATNKRIQQIKAQEKFREWLEKKQETNAAERQRCKIERRSRELAEREKRRQAEESFQTWLRSNRSNFTRKRSPYTYCISDGVLMKYFDRMAAPEPGFVNENSWVS